MNHAFVQVESNIMQIQISANGVQDQVRGVISEDLL